MMIDRIEINLLPVEYRIRKRTINIPRSIVYPAVLFVVLAIVAALYTVHLNDTETQLEKEIDDLKKDLEANKHVKVEMDKLRESKKNTEEKIRALKRINVNREKWANLLEIFADKLPSYTWLVTVKEDADGGKLNIEARTYSFPAVAHYMSRLEETEYINRVDLTGIEQIQGQDRKVYKFNIVCIVNKNAGLTGVNLEEDDENKEEKDTGKRPRRQRRQKAAKEDS